MSETPPGEQTRLVLASASPRRAELLRQVGVPFEILVAEVDESPRGEPPAEYVARLAREKAAAAFAIASRRSAPRPGRGVILAADTTVVLDGIILGKPSDAAGATGMLEQLAGRRHVVSTGYCLRWLRPGAPIAAERVVDAAVDFRPLAAAEIAAYVAAGEWRGKAGGYAVQGMAAAFVRAVHGSYTAVIGLPLSEVLEDLAAIGVLPHPPYPPSAEGRSGV